MRLARLALLHLLAAIAPASALAADTPAVTLDQVRVSLYAYDRALPLQPVLRTLEDQSPAHAALRTRYRIEYDSARDQRVTGIYTVPRRFRGPHPAVILLHGSGGHKDSDYVRFASDMMSTLGYATLSIDGQYRGDRRRPGRSGDIHLVQSPTNRDAWIQTVVDLRRAVDFLESRDGEVEPSRIAFVGFSQGGMLGGVFVGVEPRVRAAILAVAGAGFVEWSQLAGLHVGDPPADLVVNASVTDPLHFVGRFAPRPLLVLSARRDELIPVRAAEALFAAAGEPKRQVWFESGHVLPPTALLRDARAFLLEHLGTRTPSAPVAGARTPAGRRR
ncbi:MAG TPA: acetylxylan esterase [Chthonomonadales bacterium]|nr:acetylxylan esterase [Chthonomonadales bacterium]